MAKKNDFLKDYLATFGLIDIAENPEGEMVVLIEGKLEITIGGETGSVYMVGALGEVPKNHNLKKLLYKELGKYMLSIFHSFDIVIISENNYLKLIGNSLGEASTERMDRFFSKFISAYEATYNIYSRVIELEKFNSYEYA